MRTSAPGRTAVSAVAVLLLGTGSATSGSPLTTKGSSVALLVIVPPLAVTRATMLTGGIAAPTACGPGRVQVTTPAAWAQLQPPPLAETKLVDGGRLSRMRMPAEALGPALLALSV